MKLYLIVACIAFLALITGVSAPPVPAASVTHYADSLLLVNGNHIGVNNPYTHKITLSNNTGSTVTYVVTEQFSNLLTLVSPTTGAQTYSGQDQTWTFELTIPAYSSSVLDLVIANETENAINNSQVKSEYWIKDSTHGQVNNFQYHITIQGENNTPPIPEYPLAAIPIAVVLGSFFIINKKMKK